MGVTVADRSTDILVQQWSYWAHSNPGKLGYPRLSAFASLMKAKPRPALVISDDTALLVDELIARLCRRNENMGQALVAYHFCNRNISRASRVLGYDRRVMTNLVSSGTAWIDGALEHMPG